MIARGLLICCFGVFVTAAEPPPPRWSPDPFDLTVSLSGIASLVETDTGEVLVFYPNLADLSWLPGNFGLDPGDVAYHQLRIFANRAPGSVPPHIYPQRGFPCHGAVSRRWMINASETLPARSFGLEFELVTQLSSQSATEIPAVNRHLWCANWPRRGRRIADVFLKQSVPLAESRYLAGRLSLGDIDLDDLEVRPWPEAYTLNRRPVTLPKAIVWKGKVKGPVKLCFRELTSRLEDESRCIEWHPDGDPLHLRFEHQPPHVHGYGCRGGKKDFIAHYALLANVDDLPILPLPMYAVGKKEEPGFADDAMCSPMEVR